MSHDLYASWVTTELSSLFKSNTDIVFKKRGVDSSDITAFANRESGRVWPIPDGRISLDAPPDIKIEVALELKRTNEGRHGVLTAIGQSLAYLKKGYDISVIAVPDKYDSDPNPGLYIEELLNSVDQDSNIVVVSYSPPDESQVSPFHGKLTIHRPISFNPASINPARIRGFNAKRSGQQWAHVREGSTDVHSLFKYLQTAKFVSATEDYQETIFIKSELEVACQTIAPQMSPAEYLSSATGIDLHSDIWRKFWFDYVLTSDMQIIWEVSPSPKKKVANVHTKLKHDAANFKKMFGGRSDSIKDKIVSALNASGSNEKIMKAVNGEVRDKLEQLNSDNLIDLTIILPEALSWLVFAINIHDRAHSLREDIDSGLSHIAMLDDDGRPSELGYRFVDLCERTKDCFTGRAFKAFGAALLKEGQLATFLHYVHRISEEKFAQDPLAFSSGKIVDSKLEFRPKIYLNHLQSVMADKLGVINSSSKRGGVARRPFQGELAVLTKLGIVRRTKRYRMSCGLIINWPKLSEYLDSSKSD